MRAAVAVLVLAMVCAGGGAAAQTASDIARAKAHYEVGLGQFNLGNYHEAIGEFAAGYRLTRSPRFLINIGQSYRRLHDRVHARAMFARYLDEAPADDDQRPAVEHLIAALDAEPAGPNTVNPPPNIPDLPHMSPNTANTPPPNTPNTPPSTANNSPNTANTPANTANTANTSPNTANASAPAAPSRASRGRAKLIAGSVVAAVGAGSLIAGGLLFGHALGLNDDLGHPAPGTVFDPAVQNRRDAFAGAGVALLSVGAVAVVAGTIVIGLGARERRR